MKLRLTAPRFLAAAIVLMAGATAGMGQTVKRITQSQAMNAATSKPTPEYSSMAKQLRVQGPVEVNAYVSEDGKVERVEAVSGNPILLKCAQDAVRKWTFQPFKEDDKPVKVVANLTFSFKL